MCNQRVTNNNLSRWRARKALENKFKQHTNKKKVRTIITKQAGQDK